MALEFLAAWAPPCVEVKDEQLVLQHSIDQLIVVVKVLHFDASRILPPKGLGRTAGGLQVDSRDFCHEEQSRGQESELHFLK
mmetsp:Transcript_16429/g.27848  ORF Transcript_16429/g.27848 Transcript_16429/m.27848 type:complete len:82 (-) Transcript_16429:8-253(-)